MSGRVDHRQNSMIDLDDVAATRGVSYRDPHALISYVEGLMMATAAQAEATLALVEQQRIANILAAAHLPGDAFEHEKMLDIREGLGL